MKYTETHLDLLTVGQVSSKAGVNRQTLLYYEREGLLEAPNRKESGYRVYPPDTVQRICFIKRAQKLGFTLTEVKELLALTPDNPTACHEAKHLTEQKIHEIESKLLDLSALKNTLVTLLDSCDGKQTPKKCSILNALTH